MGTFAEASNEPRKFISAKERAHYYARLELHAQLKALNGSKEFEYWRDLAADQLTRYTLPY